MKHLSLILFLLGIGSFAVGPFASVPGVIIGRRYQDRGMLGQFGYGLCWIFSVLFALAFVAGFIAAITFPLWHH